MWSPLRLSRPLAGSKTVSKNLPFTGQVEQYSLADARLLDRICSTVPAMLYEYVIDDGGISRCLFCSEYSRTLLGVEPDAFVLTFTCSGA